VDAVLRSSAGREHEPLHAPELIDPETLNGLRLMALGARLDERRATEAAADLERVPLVRYPHAPLRPRIWALRHQLTAYDASYLALAEALDGSTLMTADSGLAARVRGPLGAGRVELVGAR